MRSQTEEEYEIDDSSGSEDLGDTGDWLPWLSYSEIPGVYLGPRPKVFREALRYFCFNGDNLKNFRCSMGMTGIM